MKDQKLEELLELPFDEYMKKCAQHYYDKQSDFERFNSGAFQFAQTLWARRYYLYKNGAYEL